MFGLKLATPLMSTTNSKQPNIYVRFVRFWKEVNPVAQADSLRYACMNAGMAG
jgi:hypothetical protein